MELAKAGYLLDAMMSENSKVLDDLDRWVNGTDDDDDGSEGGDYSYIPRLDL